MASAPYTRVAQGPSPALTGTSLTVLATEGAKFPETPFTALVWPSQTIPTATNSERVEVTQVVGDVLTIVRAASPIAIVADLMIAAVSVMPTYARDVTVRLTKQFSGAGDAPTIKVRRPAGLAASFGTATGVVRTGSSAYYDATTDRSGIWHYRWSATGEVRDEEDLFVEFSDVV